MPDFDVTIKLSQLQGYELELAQLKARNRFLENTYIGTIAKITHQQLLEAKQNIIDALNSQLDRKREEYALIVDELERRGKTITELWNEKEQLKTQLAATIARDTSFTLSGDYQMAKISKEENLKSYKEMYPNWQSETKAESKSSHKYIDSSDTYGEHGDFDNDIDDEPDPSIGW